jgi:hypothetical protein
MGQPSPIVAYPVGNSPFKINNNNNNGSNNGNANSNPYDYSPNNGNNGSNPFGSDGTGLKMGGLSDDPGGDIGGNFFSQLDSMIAAVKDESSAFDSMKHKLLEVEGLRSQITNHSKRLLESDQQNINLKSNLLKAQEAFSSLKKAKHEVSKTK